MPNKTIYVSQDDEPLFEEARQLAGESLSAVIVRALRDFVIRQQEKEKSMKEITVLVGPKESTREQRFIGSYVGKWQGFDVDKTWMVEAQIYLTHKKNWAVLVKQLSKASLLTNPVEWIKSGAFLVDPTPRTCMWLKPRLVLRENSRRPGCGNFRNGKENRHTQ